MNGSGGPLFADDWPMTGRSGLWQARGNEDECQPEINSHLLTRSRPGERNLDTRQKLQASLPHSIADWLNESFKQVKIGHKSLESREHRRNEGIDQERKWPRMNNVVLPQRLKKRIPFDTNLQSNQVTRINSNQLELLTSKGDNKHTNLWRNMM